MENKGLIAVELADNPVVDVLKPNPRYRQFVTGGHKSKPTTVNSKINIPNNVSVPATASL